MILLYNIALIIACHKNIKCGAVNPNPTHQSHPKLNPQLPPLLPFSPSTKPKHTRTAQQNVYPTHYNPNHP